MKEDYLWDKTGNDPEIEHFERSLAQFRIQQPSKPETAPHISAAENAPSFWRALIPGFRLAFAGSVIIALLSVGLFINSTTRSTDEISVKVPTILPANAIDSGISDIERESPAIRLSVSSTPKVARKAAKRSRNVVKTQTRTRVSPPADDTAEAGKSNLTKEEKYAYDQLMIALSVTSSKLRLVKDKVSLNHADEILVKKD